MNELSRASSLEGVRVLAVHAHPDDEVLFTGGTIAALRARGAQVAVLTTTLGEEGDVIGEPFSGLTGTDLLGGFRLRELQDSLRILEATGFQLGGVGYFRDSGMAGSPAHSNPHALVNRVDEAAEHIARFLEIYAPDAVLTYGPDGGYGHPDHIAVHQATHLACADKGISNIWWAVYHRASLYRALDTITPAAGWQKPSRAYADNFTNAACDLVIDLDDHALRTKIDAMRVHATQIWLGDGSTTPTNPESAYAVCTDPALSPVAFALSNRLVMPVLRQEYFLRASSSKPLAADGDALDHLVRGV
ncbi:MAG: PIG-L family deacetylase [Corynebacterium sp.]|nr:PIG-L family deacetylase [Corynebacterium sp.]